MKKPLVSVIIISYQGAKYLQSAIDSVISQTYRQIEIIHVDDGSSDETQEIVDLYKPSGKIIGIKTVNRGMGCARSAGVLMANGKYIQFLDGDDLLCPNKIESQVEQLEANPHIGFSNSKTLCFVEGNPKEWMWCTEQTLEQFQGDKIFDLMAAGCCAGNIASPLFRASILKLPEIFPIYSRTNDDLILIGRLALHGCSVLYDSKSQGFRYRQTPSHKKKPWQKMTIVISGELWAWKHLQLECLIWAKKKYRLCNHQINRLSSELILIKLRERQSIRFCDILTIATYTLKNPQSRFFERTVVLLFALCLKKIGITNSAEDTEDKIITKLKTIKKSVLEK